MSDDERDPELKICAEGARRLREICKQKGVDIIVTLSSEGDAYQAVVFSGARDREAKVCARALKTFTWLCDALGLDSEKALAAELAEVRIKKAAAVKAETAEAC